MTRSARLLPLPPEHRQPLRLTALACALSVITAITAGEAAAALSETSFHAVPRAVAPRPWLTDQAARARSIGRIDIERDALRRMLLMRPHDPGLRLEAVRLELADPAADPDRIAELVATVCAISKDEHCRQARAAVALATGPMAEKISQARMLFLAGQTEAAVKIFEEAFAGTGGRPPEDATGLEYWTMVLALPAREAEARREMEALIARAADSGATLLAERGRSILDRHNFERMVEDAVAGINQNRSRAKSATGLRRALELAPDDPRADYWRRSLNGALFWLGVDRGDELLARGRYAAAARAYREAAPYRPGLPYAHLGLANVARAQQRWDEVRSHLRAALSACGDASAAERRRVARLLAELPADIAMARAESFSRDAGRAASAGDAAREAEYMERAFAIRAPTPWEVYSLADAHLRAGDTEKALETWERWAPKAGTLSAEEAADWDWPHALFLSNAGRTREAAEIAGRHSGAAARTDGWTALGSELSSAERLADLARSLEEGFTLERADALAAEGDVAAAADTLASIQPTEGWLVAKLARWQEAAGCRTEAVRLWQSLESDPDLGREARMNTIRLMMAGTPAERDAALARLDALMNEQELDELTPAGLVTLADLLSEAGRMDAARPLYARAGEAFEREDRSAWLVLGAPADAAAQDGALSSRTEENAMALRTAAMALEKSDPQRALSLYRLAFVSAGLLPMEEKDSTEAFTRATRTKDDDNEAGWLTVSLKSRAAELQLAQTPVVTTGLRVTRDSGTSGYSDLSTFTWMKELRMPALEGEFTLRADTAYWNVGDLTLNTPWTTAVGTCWAAGCTDPGIGHDLGESVAVAWRNDRFAFDIGTTPMGFRETNVTGSAAWSWQTGTSGWTVIAYRRPKTSSLLSYGGLRDPGTGWTWGGVMRTGGRLSWSHDEGGANGFWAFVSYEKLDGKNVADNHAVQAMAGWYRRLVDLPNRETTAGLSVMYWGFGKDLSDYYYGQGGYFSPERYFSAGLSLSDARRTDDWSWILEGRLGVSHSTSPERDRYPLRAGMPAIQDLYARDAAESSTGIGLTLRGAFEHRLSRRVVVGGEAEYQHADGYVPLVATLWLRWYLDDWAGDLPLPPVAPIPYSEW
ncbi:cellulose synthase subunit BcsC-related outer membrane protein [Sutterella sp.]|uniref:cellulose synthase subunit BcsC-related outer membrane protein n=1 Tax=Sutterella sp. TaxID=1981025 RepID=UPI0026DEDAE7|nr:cellulose synthase subunit BcsC-related outer membrane protein [Sutterella sp.]MDO5531235.1 cellulose synthase subunit BcsC-related outer membrane protein [Sutterella sp.]